MTQPKELSIKKRKRVEREVSSTENTKAFVFETKPALVYTRGHLYMHTPSLTLFPRACQLVFIQELIEAVSMMGTSSTVPSPNVQSPKRRSSILKERERERKSPTRKEKTDPT